MTPVNDRTISGYPRKMANTSSISEPPLTSSTSTVPDADTVFFEFTNVQNTSVCGTDLFTWIYFGNISSSLALSVTNDGVAGEQGNGSLITQLLYTQSDGLYATETFDWAPVTVPAGAYTAVMSIFEVPKLFYSGTFYVVDSGNHTCLNSSGSTTTLSGSGFTTFRAMTVSPTMINSGGTTSPTEGAARSRLPNGAIAGIIVGIAVLLGILLGVFFLIRYQRSRTDTSKTIAYKREDGRIESGVDITSLAVLEKLAEHDPSIALDVGKAERRRSPEPIAVDHFLQQCDKHAHRDLHRDTQPSSIRSSSRDSSYSDHTTFSAASDPFADPPSYG